MSSSRYDNTQVVTIDENRIDAAIAIAFKDRMRDLTENGPAHVILNLDGVEFIDSSGLGAIVAAMKQMGQNRTLQLAGLMPNVEKVFRLTRMDTVFRIHESVDAALSANAG
ncbi:Anti-anti-sigma-B factor [Thalassovita gelatinovora]|uniref:Anti-sigma factor antagonist n=2 Tax=Thalassovita gelatinovora TaxID=53501 RepID=A0A0P1F631_THAGE|nr:Anti-anti-sigma-B factor [Thalassovita gelatinovora]SEQ65508.1 anti-sigma B factor antagonist [Thalassovita gelatinovora]